MTQKVQFCKIIHFCIDNQRWVKRRYGFCLINDWLGEAIASEELMRAAQMLDESTFRRRCRSRLKDYYRKENNRTKRNSSLDDYLEFL